MIEPGGTLGIIGAGQLGRMLALAAARYGVQVHVFAPESGPAFDVAATHTCAPYEDEAAVTRFAQACGVITYEFENVPRRTAELVAAHAPLHPSPRALAVTQDRLEEKTFVAGLDIRTAPFRAVSDAAELSQALDAIGQPAVLKTRRFGYDGKGQAMIRAQDAPEAAWEALGGAACILEGFVPFEREVSVVAARTATGAFAAYDLCANTHRNHILDTTEVPAGLSPAPKREALDIARRLADALDYVGVLAVEMFVVREGGAERIVVNEIAPRVHNSGHWTLEGTVTSQFEQHVRAVCGWPLGSPARLGRVRMTNLIGEDAARWRDVIGDPQAHLHLYGKRTARPGRKMGHVTWVWPDEA
jgi:5-(carboxyamino)imidazole ribonucleotide synthase